MVWDKVNTSQFVLFQDPRCHPIWFQLYFLGVLCSLCKGGMDGKNECFYSCPDHPARSYCNYQREIAIFMLMYSKLVINIPVLIT